MYYKYRKEGFQGPDSSVAPAKTSEGSSVGLYIGIGVLILIVAVFLFLYFKQRNKQNFGFRFY
jgi:LPXTG-motif cell wall-anchored protein